MEKNKAEIILLTSVGIRYYITAIPLPVPHAGLQIQLN